MGNIRKRGVCIVLAALIGMQAAAFLTGCSNTNVDPVNAILATGLLYGSDDNLDEAVTKQEAIAAVAEFAGLEMEYAYMDESDISSELRYIKDSDDIDDSYKTLVAVANKAKLFDKSDTTAGMKENVPGSEVGYMAATALGLDPEDSGDALEKLKKAENITGKSKKIFEKESITRRELCTVLFDMLRAEDYKLGSKLALQYKLEEKTAFKNNLADSYFAVRLENTVSETESVSSVSGIVDCMLLQNRVEELKELYSCYNGSGSDALKKAAGEAKRAIAKGEKEIEKFLSEAGRAENKAEGSGNILSVSDREAAVSEITEKAPTVKNENGILTLENAYSRFVFRVSGGFALTSYFNFETNTEMTAEDSPIFEYTYKDVLKSGSDYAEASVKISEETDVITVSFTFGESDEVTPVLTVRMDKSREASFDLTIKNNTAEEVELKPVFPVINRISIGNSPMKNWYMYPRKGGIISQKTLNIRETSTAGMYGKGVTFPVIDIYDETAGGGSYVMLKYDFEQVKTLGFAKKGDGATIRVAYFDRNIPAGDSWSATTAAVASHPGDWYEAILAYREYLSEWYDFQAESDSLDGVVIFKQVFIKQGEGTIIHELEGDGKLPHEMVGTIFSQGKEEFGNYQVLHWFDWWDNLGDYNFYSGYGGASEMRNVMDEVHMLGKKMSLYSEGILANLYSQVYLNKGNNIFRLNKDGKLHVNNGSFDITCPEGIYGQLYTDRIADIVREVPVDIFYLDQFGNQQDVSCYNPKHDHQDHYGVLKGQINLLKDLQQKLDAIRPGIAIGGEYPVTDYMSQFTTFNFNYNSCRWYNRLDGIGITPTVDLYGFIFPEQKLYNLTFRPVEGSDYDNLNNAASSYIEDMQSLKLTFFNGQGRWHDEGYTEWKDDMKAFAAKAERALEGFYDVFFSENKMPSLITGREDVFVNKFWNDDESQIIYTVLNNSEEKLDAIEIELENGSDYIYFDILENRQLDAKTENGKVVISLETAAGDVSGVAAVRK